VRPSGACALLLAAAAAFWLGCATCRSDQPPVRPSVGGSIGGGSGGFYHSTGVGLDVTNLFCRAPQTGQPGQPSDSQPQAPVPGTPPIPDAPAPAGSPPAASPPAQSPPADSQR
jgi:hypothetical protein